MPKRYPEELKRRAIGDYKNGVPVQKVCRVNNVAISTIYRWLRDYEDEIPVPHYATLLRKKEHLEHVLGQYRTGKKSNTVRYDIMI